MEKINMSGYGMWKTVLAASVGAFFLSGRSEVLATFHFMQIEQVVAGVNGNPSAQAIQLRMRTAEQDHVELSKLVVVDAAGGNPIVLIDFDEDVDVEVAGSRVLVTTSAMAAYTDPPVVADFVMTNPIPVSYLAAGSLIFVNDEETLLVWRLSWGGSAYTGPTIGAFTNDDDREFGPPWPTALPTSGVAGLLFDGAFSDKSTNNAADYVLSEPAVLTNNAGATFTVTAPDCADATGAGPDSDGDGVRDACDGCPGDPLKTEPGVCGCGVADDDADGDGVVDCIQQSGPDDNGGTQPGDDSSGGAPDDSANDGSSQPGDDSGASGDTSDDGSGGGSSSGGGGSGSGTIRRPCAPAAGTILWLATALLGLRFGPHRRRVGNPSK